MLSSPSGTISLTVTRVNLVLGSPVFCALPKLNGSNQFSVVFLVQDQFRKVRVVSSLADEKKNKKMVQLLLLVISSTFVALPPTIESNNVDLTLSASDGAIAVVSSAGQIEDLVNVLKDVSIKVNKRKVRTYDRANVRSCK